MVTETIFEGCAYDRLFSLSDGSNWRQIGNRRSHVYHAPHCRAAAIMKPENRVEFKTAAEAEEKGYRKGGDCK